MGVRGGLRDVGGDAVEVNDFADGRRSRGVEGPVSRAVFAHCWTGLGAGVLGGEKAGLRGVCGESGVGLVAFGRFGGEGVVHHVGALLIGGRRKAPVKNEL